MAKLSVGKFVDLGDAQAFYIKQVDDAAVTYNQELMPPDKAPIYEAKYAAAQKPKKASVWLDAEAQALGITREEVAESILTARTQWEEEVLRVETARVKAKRDIRKARTPVEAQAIWEQFRLLAAS